MSSYTRVGAYVFDWEPYVRASFRGRNFLLACYVSQIAKQWLPGILYAPVASIADAARMGSVDANAALSELIDQGTLQHDVRKRVLRFTELPDRGERPANDRVLRMFWNRWRDLPESPLKYFHVPLIEWLAEAHRTEKLQSLWNATFATVAPPDTVSVDNSRGIVQPPLFSASKDTVSHTVSDTVGVPLGYGYGYGNGGGEGSGEGGAGGRGDETAQPFSVSTMLVTVTERAGGRIAVLGARDPRMHAELERLVGLCHQGDVTLEDLRLAGELVGAGHLAYRSDLDARWLTAPGVLLGLVEKARQWVADGRKPINRSRERYDAQKPTAGELALRAQRIAEEEDEVA